MKEKITNLAETFGEPTIEVVSELFLEGTAGALILGLSLIVSSQRPSELSKTILSQCNSFIVHRLQNPEDQKYIKQIVSSANSDLLNLLPVLPQQHAIIMGEAVRSPVQLKINDIKTKPDSSNPKYIEQWLKEKNDIDIDKVVEEWIKN